MMPPIMAAATAPMTMLKAVESVFAPFDFAGVGDALLSVGAADVAADVAELVLALSAEAEVEVEELLFELLALEDADGAELVSVLLEEADEEEEESPSFSGARLMPVLKMENAFLRPPQASAAKPVQGKLHFARSTTLSFGGYVFPQ